MKITIEEKVYDFNDLELSLNNTKVTNKNLLRKAGESLLNYIRELNELEPNELIRILEINPSEYNNFSNHLIAEGIIRNYVRHAKYFRNQSIKSYRSKVFEKFTDNLNSAHRNLTYKIKENISEKESYFFDIFFNGFSKKEYNYNYGYGSYSHYIDNHKMITFGDIPKIHPQVNTDFFKNESEKFLNWTENQFEKLNQDKKRASKILKSLDKKEQISFTSRKLLNRFKKDNIEYTNRDHIWELIEKNLSTSEIKKPLDKFRQKLEMSDKEILDIFKNNISEFVYNYYYNDAATKKIKSYVNLFNLDNIKNLVQYIKKTKKGLNNWNRLSLSQKKVFSNKLLKLDKNKEFSSLFEILPETLNFQLIYANEKEFLEKMIEHKSEIDNYNKKRIIKHSYFKKLSNLEKISIDSKITDLILKELNEVELIQLTIDAFKKEKFVIILEKHFLRLKGTLIKNFSSKEILLFLNFLDHNNYFTNEKKLLIEYADLIIESKNERLIYNMLCSSEVYQNYLDGINLISESLAIELLNNQFEDDFKLFYNVIKSDKLKNKIIDRMLLNVKNRYSYTDQKTFQNFLSHEISFEKIKSLSQKNKIKLYLNEKVLKKFNKTQWHWILNNLEKIKIEGLDNKLNHVLNPVSHQEDHRNIRKLLAKFSKEELIDTDLFYDKNKHNSNFYANNFILKFGYHFLKSDKSRVLCSRDLIHTLNYNPELLSLRETKGLKDNDFKNLKNLINENGVRSRKDKIKLENLKDIIGADKLVLVNYKQINQISSINNFIHQNCFFDSECDKNFSSIASIPFILAKTKCNKVIAKNIFEKSIKKLKLEKKNLIGKTLEISSKEYIALFQLKETLEYFYDKSNLDSVSLVLDNLHSLRHKNEDISDFIIRILKFLNYNLQKNNTNNQKALFVLNSLIVNFEYRDISELAQTYYIRDVIFKFIEKISKSKKLDDNEIHNINQIISLLRMHKDYSREINQLIFINQLKD